MMPSIRSSLYSAVLSSLLLTPTLELHAQEVRAKEPNRGGEISLETTDPAIALERLRPAEGFEVSLFASEKDFPIGNPVAIAFDSQGRLWVSTMPTYPHYQPGDPPTDKLIILEDTDGDGRADQHTVFADSLYLAAGFELGDGGVYVAQQPNLMFLKDTDGDDVADERKVILHGFGTEDSHHAISAFTWGPGGGLYMQEGTFHHSQVETPYGPVRVKDAAVFRYEPHTEKLSVFVSYPFANPWGHVFDRWGQDFIADASNGNNYFALPISGRVEHPQKHPSMRVFTSKVRPTAGAEFIRSRHFPDEFQGNFLVTNVIGFQGIKNHQVIEEGSGFTSQEDTPLLTSSDINFRPIDLEFGPDGALYLADWFNPLIGHMQYSLRDPRRDKKHGRIWRLTHKERPLLSPPNLDTLSVPELLDQLKVYEDRTRYRVRRELRERDRAEVRQALDSWTNRLSSDDPEHERHLLEALWVYQSRDLFEPKLLQRLLRADDGRVRAAATRVLRFWSDRVDDPVELLRQQVNDRHPRVRLEAVVALSFIPTVEAAEVALQALRHPMDYYLRYALGETATTLKSHWKPKLLAGEKIAPENPAGVLFLLDRLEPEEVAKTRRDANLNRALLARAGVETATRRIALADLTRQTGASQAEELLGALRASDTSPDADAAVEDLVVMLAEAPADELQSVRSELERLAREAKNARIRQGAYAVLLQGVGGPEHTWRWAQESPQAMADLLNGLDLVQTPAHQEALYPRVRDLVKENLADSQDGRTRPLLRAAVQALVELPGHEEERLALFGELLSRGIMPELAVEGAARVLESGWQGEDPSRLASQLLEYARAIKPAERRGSTYERITELGNQLAPQLPAGAGERLVADLDALRVLKIRIRAPEAQMRFDLESFEVAAGQEVEIVFENVDAMPHNVVIGAPGSREKIGRAADAMAGQPDAFERSFVPDLPEVLFATELIGSGEQATLRFRVPEKTGDYPYICSFPGHWITMYGTMQVKPSGERSPAT